MESNFQWKIYRQSQNDNVNILLASAELALVVEMTPKKIFRNQVDVAFTPHSFLRKICTGGQHVRGMYRKNSGMETIF